MSPGNMLTVFDARDPRGPLDPTERAAALAVCARATSRADAIHLLDMLGLLREVTP